MSYVSIGMTSMPCCRRKKSKNDIPAIPNVRLAWVKAGMEAIYFHESDRSDPY